MGKYKEPKKEIEMKGVKPGPKLAADLARMQGKDRAKQLRSRSGAAVTNAELERMRAGG